MTSREDSLLSCFHFLLLDKSLRQEKQLLTLDHSTQFTANFIASMIIPTTPLSRLLFLKKKRHNPLKKSALKLTIGHSLHLLQRALIQFLVSEGCQVVFETHSSWGLSKTSCQSLCSWSAPRVAQSTLEFTRAPVTSFAIFVLLFCSKRQRQGIASCAYGFAKTRRVFPEICSEILNKISSSQLSIKC